jgi:hypothetical protein
MITRTPAALSGEALLASFGRSEPTVTRFTLAPHCRH